MGRLCDRVEMFANGDFKRPVCRTREAGVTDVIAPIKHRRVRAFIYPGPALIDAAARALAQRPAAAGGRR